MSILFPSMRMGRSSSSTFRSCGICLRIALSAVLAYNPSSEWDEYDGLSSTYSIDLSYLFREDRAVPQRVNVGRVETVRFAIAVEGLLAKTHFPNRVWRGKSPTYVDRDGGGKKSP